MPINLKSTADFWARIKGDSVSSGDGTSNSTPARYDTWNQDIGSQDDGAASSDSGTSSLIGLVKRFLGKVPALTVSSTRLLVDGSGVTQPVSASSLPLPSGASTSANQTTANTSLASIDSKVPSLGQALSTASVPVVLPAVQITALTPLSSISVSNFPSTQAVTQSGTWNFNSISGTISLPTGASTSALQTTANTSLASIDTKVPALGQALSAASVPVVLPAAQITTLTPPSSVGISGSLPAGTNAIGSITNTSFASTQSGTWNINNVSGVISLPTGAATSANQATGNTSLASIDTKLPSLGQALAAGSVPVVLPVAQVTTLTPPTTVTVIQSTAANLLTTATINTRSESAATPLASRLSDGSAFISSTNPLAINPYDLAGTIGSITAVDSASTSTAASDGQVAVTGAPTTNSAVSVAVSGKSAMTVQLAGTFVATVRFERSHDGGTTWYPLPAMNTYNLAVFTSVSSIGSFQLNTAGYTHIRVRCTTFTSGTVNLSFQSGVGAGFHSVLIARRRLTYASATISTSGDNTIIAAPGANTRILYPRIRIQNKSGSSTNIIIKDGSTQIDEIVTSATGDGIAEVYPVGFQPALSLNSALIFNLSAANSTSYSVWYYLE